VGDVRVVRIDALGDDPLLQQWVDVREESQRYAFGDRHTVTTIGEVQALHRLVTDSELALFGAVVDDELVGAARLRLHLLDNPHLGDLSLEILPSHRRRGVGSQLLRHLESVAAERGRTTVRVESDVLVGRPDPAAGFAAAHGYTAALVDLRSDLDLPADGNVDRLLGPLEAETASYASGYQTTTWWDDVPEQWLDQRAYLASRMSTDAPMGDLVVEEEVWDADRVREQWAIGRAAGYRHVETVAVDSATGQLAAFTDIAVADHSPTVAHQWDTLVLKEHRGRRLGMLVKATNLRALLAELPEVRRVITWNAEVNEPMLRVNRALGFVPVAVTTEWQKSLA
jgi:GNAT superfamily N-acetyltransferase